MMTLLTFAVGFVAGGVTMAIVTWVILRGGNDETN